MKIQYLLLLTCITHLLRATIENMTEMPRIGNFLNERTPNSYFGFGQKITEKGSTELYSEWQFQKGVADAMIIFYPTLVYGFRDDLCIYFILPLLPKHKVDGLNQPGIGDFLTQIEYAFYSKKKEFSITQATLVVNNTMPTGTQTANGSLGLGEPSLFVGFTLSRLSIKWYLYTSYGLTFSSGQTAGIMVRFGNNYLYQGGFGYHLGNPGGTTTTLLFDMSGTYRKNDGSNQGGNIIFAGPSLYISYHRYEFIAGVQGPLFQQFNDPSNNQQFRVLISGSARF